MLTVYFHRRKFASAHFWKNLDSTKLFR